MHFKQTQHMLLLSLCVLLARTHTHTRMHTHTHACTHTHSPEWQQEINHFIPPPPPPIPSTTQPQFKPCKCACVQWQTQACLPGRINQGRGYLGKDQRLHKAWREARRSRQVGQNWMERLTPEPATRPARDPTNQYLGCCPPNPLCPESRFSGALSRTVWPWAQLIGVTMGPTNRHTCLLPPVSFTPPRSMCLSLPRLLLRFFKLSGPARSARQTVPGAQTPKGSVKTAWVLRKKKTLIFKKHCNRSLRQKSNPALNCH